MVDFGRNVFWWASALETGVYGQSFVAARSAKGVPCVPVEEVSGFSVDGRYGVSDTKIRVSVNMDE